jgi:hypothetical protein
LPRSPCLDLAAHVTGLFFFLGHIYQPRSLVVVIVQFSRTSSPSHAVCAARLGSTVRERGLLSGVRELLCVIDILVLARCSQLHHDLQLSHHQPSAFPSALHSTDFSRVQQAGDANKLPVIAFPNLFEKGAISVIDAILKIAPTHSHIP